MGDVAGFHFGPWEVVGAIGQVVFGARFLIQWIASERKGEVVVPTAFWWLSIVGSLICLAAAIGIGSPSFAAGYLLNCIPYGRNLVLETRSKNDRIRAE